jgi:chemotaxis protein MotB
VSEHGGGHDDDEHHEEHEEHVNHEAWVIPYADLLTLLMAMFIALFAISNVDAAKFKKLAEGFHQALGGGAAKVTLFEGGPSVVGTGGETASTAVVADETAASDPASPQAALATLKELGDRVKAVEEESKAQLAEVQQQIEAQAAGQGLAGNLSFRIEDRGLVVTVVTDQVLFGSGSAGLVGDGPRLLAVVGQALRGIDNPVMVEGHTDSIPINTAAFPSNWELSTARAGAVVRFFQEQVGIPASRLQATGWGDQRPVDTNATNEGRARNRRVEVVVQSTAASQNERLFEEAVTASDRLHAAEQAASAAAVEPSAGRSGEAPASGSGEAPAGTTQTTTANAH